MKCHIALAVAQLLVGVIALGLVAVTLHDGACLLVEVLHGQECKPSRLWWNNGLLTQWRQ